MLGFSFQVALAGEITKDNVIELVNESRRVENISPLIENEILKNIAEDKLEDMIKNSYFAHTSPSGINPWYWFSQNKYDYKYAGENLAINFMTVEKQHEAWMKSETHRKNIMNPNYEEIGVAVAAGEINGQVSLVVVQEFGTQAGSAGAKNNEQNFSGQGKANLVKVGERITPAVLSAKEIKEIRDVTPGQSGGNYPAADKSFLVWHLQNIAILLLVLSSSVAPLLVVFSWFNQVRTLIAERQSVYRVKVRIA